MACLEMPALLTHGAGFFLELRKRLQSGLLIVQKDVAAEGPAEVVVAARDSSLHIRASGAEFSLTLPAGVSFMEGCCTPTPTEELGGDELHFRLRITVNESEDEDTSDGVMERLREKESYCFHCQACMTRLLEDRVFRRVLPLPNGNWNAIVDEWCCHPDPFASKKLLPRVEDCLLGDTFFLLARDSSCEQTLTEEESVGTEDSQDPKKPCRRLTVISCKSCSSVLGEAIAPETLKLYITQVVVEPTVGDREPEASLNRSFFLERTIAARLLEMSNTLCTFRFSVQTPDGKAFLLLWLLNSDAIIAPVLQMSTEGEGEGEGPISTPAPHTLSPKAARALKLLYIACSDRRGQQRDIIASWEVNAIGHPVVLPLNVCDELLRVMDDSNSSLPASMRHMRTYKVAYLRL